MNAQSKDRMFFSSTDRLSLDKSWNMSPFSNCFFLSYVIPITLVNFISESL